MLGFIIDTIINIFLSFVSFIGGVVTSDTVAGTAFVYTSTPTTKPSSSSALITTQNKNRHQNQLAIVRMKSPHSQFIDSVLASSSSRENSLARNVRLSDEMELQQRRVKLCKYFLVMTLFGVAGALAAWDRWPLLWLLRLQCFIVGFCALIKGSDEMLRNDYLRIPMTVAPWILAIDFFFLS